VRRHMLCPALLGMESATHGRACFARQIGRCRGACIGDESEAAHGARLLAALEKLNAEVWPYGGPIGIIETDDRLRQIHVVDRWSYIGSLEGRRRKIRLPVKRAVDIDTWKILAGPLANGELKFAPCEVRQSAAYYIE
jgi:excinuclease Cho